ncbi:uncharacterized protein LOC131843342 [Achroia grisella]|uniref:uncharacterized protein LOC131843342 n=1 Tax=Achroia grisella TaxID=688607 RepID=UPI0027D2A86A|nr:uncharacterized protein LOC131843342 [Achroia grisella]
MTSNLESEDLENVPLVRMEDVQPSRDRTCEVSGPEVEEEVVLETSIIDSGDHESQYILDDEDTESMMSIKIEKGNQYDGSNSGELIVPEYIETHEIPVDVKVERKRETKPAPDSWPTLEILPGGVIKNAEKSEDSVAYNNDTDSESGEMMYACAKCPQSFKYLFRLVKHVRWHEDEEKKQREGNISKSNTDASLASMPEKNGHYIIANGYKFKQNGAQGSYYYCSNARCRVRIKLGKNGHISQYNHHMHLPPKKYMKEGFTQLDIKEDKYATPRSAKTRIITKINKRKLPKKNKS